MNGHSRVRPVVVVLALVGCGVATVLTLFQVEVLDSVWEPNWLASDQWPCHQARTALAFACTELSCSGVLAALAGAWAGVFARRASASRPCLSTRGCEVGAPHAKSGCRRELCRMSNNDMHRSAASEFLVLAPMRHAAPGNVER